MPCCFQLSAFSGRKVPNRMDELQLAGMVPSVGCLPLLEGEHSCPEQEITLLPAFRRVIEIVANDVPVEDPAPV